MKISLFLFILLLSIKSFAQQHLPHGSVFGDKPNTIGMMDASKVEAFMGKKARISTTLRGKVLSVTKSKGGWFDMDAGGGRIIAAHFTNYNINIPANLKGHTIIVEGIAQKQFIADDGQHFAGDTVVGKKQHTVNVDPKRRLTFEVKGLEVE